MSVAVMSFQSMSLEDKTWIMVNYDPHCQYRVRIKPIFLQLCGMGEGDWTEEEIYGMVSPFFLSSWAILS